MCSIDAHEKQHPSSFYDGSSGGGSVLPSNSTTDGLVSLSATIYTIYFFLKGLEHNYLKFSNMYSETMKCMFQKISCELPKALSNKEKR